jgi:hypothetical protein
MSCGFATNSLQFSKSATRGEHMHSLFLTGRYELHEIHIEA